MSDEPTDEVIDALTALVASLKRQHDLLDRVFERAEVVRRERGRGASYAEILTSSNGPLIPELLTDMLTALMSVSGRLRRAEALALYVEGLSMDKIARLFGVSRQRVSELLRTPEGERAQAATAAELHKGFGLTLTDPEFRMIAESLPHIVFVTDADGSTEYFNRVGTDFTGLPRQANYEWNWLTHVHPDDVERAQDGWIEATRNETPFDLEYRVRRHDGEFRWHSFHAAPIRGPGGQVTKWLGTATDIEEHKRSEVQLRRAERAAAQALSLAEALQTFAPVGFGTVDCELRVLNMNQRLAAVNGAPMDKQLGCTVPELVPKLWPQMERAFTEVLHTEKSVENLEIVGETAEERDRPHRWLASYYPVHVDEELAGVGLIIVDLTDPVRRA